MPKLHIKEIAKVVNGTVEKGDCWFSAYHFDTRLITEENTLFFAFKTDSGDGHRFVRQLKDKPGAGAVVCPGFDASGLGIPLIRVDDPLKAAQQLASHVRNTHRHIKYIGITGSAGKTTTKEFIYQLLSHKYEERAFRSFKNWNNWIGMPFSILNMTGSEKAAVFELAMSYPGIGEIHLLASILRPDAAVILNVFPVHMEFLKTVDNAAQAKSEILDYLSSDDTAFINGDSEPIMKRLQKADAPKGRKIFFGRNKTNDIRLKEIHRKKGKDETRMVIDFYGIETEFTVPLVNRIHIENLFAAVTVVQHLGMKNFEIQEAVKTITPLANRGEIKRYPHFTVIDETYNSNPEAVKKTLDWVDKEYKGKKIAVLGDMLELGENEDRYHWEVGQFFASLNFNRLITVGQRALKIADGALENGFREKNTRRFDEATAAGKYLNEISYECKKSTLLFKASRGIQLEKAIEEFKQKFLEVQKPFFKKVFGRRRPKTAVIGFGKTGKGVLDFLLNLNLNPNLYLFNDTPLENPAEQEHYEKKGVTFLIGKEQFKRLKETELIVLSPGVNGRTQRFDGLRKKGIEIVSEIEFASRFIDARIIAVTGTNGKSTTVSLIHHILTHSGIKSVLTGNIGTPLISEVDKISRDSVVVLEVSSFQLEEIKQFKPDIAVLLNVTPDHLDRYATTEDYFSAKLNLVKNQDSGDYLVLNLDDPVLRESEARGGLFGAARKVWFSRGGGESGAAVCLSGNAIRLKLNAEDTVETVSLEGNPLRGVHNLENILAAVAAARLAGADPKKIQSSIPHFKGLTHRMESLGKIGKVEFINDSKATNVDAALKSITGIPDAMVVILGGKDKGGDFSILEKAIEDRVDTVLLVGQAVDTIRGQLGRLQEKFHVVKDLGEAVEEGYKRLEKKGGVVLLAPGCASFDMFKNFEHRGEVFKEEFHKLKKAQGKRHKK